MKITSNNITSRWFEIEPLVSEELKLNYDTILKSVDYIETSTEIQSQDGDTLQGVMKKENQRKRLIAINQKLIDDFVVEINKDLADKLPKEDLDSLDGIIGLKNRLIKLKHYCKNNKVDYGSELAKLCHDDDNFNELLLRVVETDESSNYDSMMAELNFISNSTNEDIVDKFMEEDDEFTPDVLIHFRDEQALTARFLELLGANIVEYLIDFNDVYKLGADPFFESLIIKLIENK